MLKSENKPNIAIGMLHPTQLNPERTDFNSQKLRNFATSHDARYK